MEAPTDKLARRAAARAEKRAEKRLQLIESASETLRALGYANASLRDIAEASGVSLGQLHYYFDDRTDLILFCVRHYKDAFLADVGAAMAGVADREGAVAALSSALARALARTGGRHRLWYDMRAQAMFDPAFRPAMEEIEAALIAVFAEAETRFAGAAPQAALRYAAVDGLFRYMMQAASDLTEETMRAAFADLLDRLWSPSPADGAEPSGRA
ncbi:MAG: TetR/AcrR family transcriptional regulator [Pseudomonadota bacterium]|nr:TetR/AcrR family transcriptional regulator [Pseudomonadota bacterium]MEE3100610.1 TetR/AcrR family transcriptional regulator [Pseudomonadota bacterium]